MNTVSVEQLYGMDFSLRVVNGLRICWTPHRIFDCIGEPKEKNLFAYIHRMKARYTFKDGYTFTASDGDVIYTPVGSEYRIEFFDVEDAQSSTYGINFFISDPSGRPFVIAGNGPTVWNNENSLHPLFEKICRYSEASVPCPAGMQAGMYEILLHLSSEGLVHTRSKYEMIAPGIDYMEKDADQLLSIEDVAALCHVSASYFRKLFKEYASCSPMEYRMRTKLEKALDYLTHENLTVTEVAQKLGFTDVAYFSKQFRKRFGTTPSAYKTK